MSSLIELGVGGEVHLQILQARRQGCDQLEFHSETARGNLDVEVAGVRESVPFQNILLVRADGDLVFDLRDIFLTLREHDGTNSTSFNRKSVLSPAKSKKPSVVAEGRVLVNVGDVFASQTFLPGVGYLGNATGWLS